MGGWQATIVTKTRTPSSGVDNNATSVVLHGRLRLGAIAPRANQDDLKHYTAVAQHPNLKEFSKGAAGGTWSLFSLDLPCDEEDPVSQVAPVVASALLTLDEVYRSQANQTG